MQCWRCHTAKLGLRHFDDGRAICRKCFSEFMLSQHGISNADFNKLTPAKKELTGGELKPWPEVLIIPGAWGKEAVWEEVSGEPSALNEWLVRRSEELRSVGYVIYTRSLSLDKKTARIVRSRESERQINMRRSKTRP